VVPRYLGMAVPQMVRSQGRRGRGDWTRNLGTGLPWPSLVLERKLGAITRYCRLNATLMSNEVACACCLLLVCFSVSLWLEDQQHPHFGSCVSRLSIHDHRPELGHPCSQQVTTFFFSRTRKWKLHSLEGIYVCTYNQLLDQNYSRRKEVRLSMYVQYIHTLYSFQASLSL
jgi:hypothetical protein